jgi:hypothetical protein
MSDRHFQHSERNGPRKMDPRLDHSGAGFPREIGNCLDCSQDGKCGFQAKAPWPATEIAEGCSLPEAKREEEEA